MHDACHARFQAGLALISFLGLSSSLARGQRPAPVENVSSFPPRTACGGTEGPSFSAGVRNPARGIGTRDQQAVEFGIRRSRKALGDEHGRVSLPRQGGNSRARFGQDSLQFRRGRPCQKIEKFADGFNIPIGLLPLPSAREAIVHNIPNIYLMRDTDGDGQADTRDAIYGIFGKRDTHGITNAFTWGFDGWI